MTTPQRFEILLTDDAQADLAGIGDQRTVRAIAKKIDGLRVEPDQQGKKLSGTLKDYRSIRAAGQRYRVIYQVAIDPELPGVVLVVLIGIRRDGHRSDAYEVAEKRLT